MFGEKVKELRVKKGLSQDKLAQRLNISRTTITMWETLQREPDFETVKTLANYFNVSTDYLLGNTNKPNRVTAPELLEYGIEWVELRKDAVSAGLSAEDIREIIKIHLDIMDKRNKKK
jgi:transcriptional regulator with XRE-family HTH domain